MEKTNINITEEIARIEKEVEQLEKELEKLEKEQQEYEANVEEAQSNKFVDKYKKEQFARNLKEKKEQVSDKQGEITEKREKIERLSRILLEIAYGNIEKDDQMVGAIFEGYIQNINDEIKEQKESKKEIDTDILDFINSLDPTIIDDLNYLCYDKYGQKDDDDKIGRYIARLQNDSKTTGRISEKLKQFYNNKKVINYSEYEDLMQMLSALKLGALSLYDASFYIKKIAQIERAIIITELNKSENKKKLADEDTIVLLNGKAISKKTIANLIDELKALEPTQEEFYDYYDKMYSNNGYKRGNAIQYNADPSIKLSEQQIEFRKKQLYEIFKTDNPSVDIIENEYIEDPNGEKVYLEDLRVQMETILDYKKISQKIAEICEKNNVDSIPYALLNCRTRYVLRMIKVLEEQEEQEEYEDILIILNRIGVMAVNGEKEELLLAYKEAVEANETNKKIDNEIKKLTDEKAKLESLTFDERKEYIRKNLSLAPYKEEDIISPKLLEGLSQKIADYFKKVNGYEKNIYQMNCKKRGNDDYESFKEKYNSIISNLNNFGIPEEEVLKIINEDKCAGSELLKLIDNIECLGTGKLSQRVKERISNRIRNYGDRDHTTIDDFSLQEEIMDEITESEEKKDSVLAESEKEQALKQKELDEFKTNKEQIESNSDDRLYQKPNGKSAKFKFLYRLTPGYRKKKKQLLSEIENKVTQKSNELESINKKIEQHRQEKLLLENAKTELDAANLKYEELFREFQNRIKIMSIIHPRTYEQIRKKVLDELGKTHDEYVRLSEEVAKCKEELETFFTKEELKAIRKICPGSIWAEDGYLDPINFANEYAKSYVSEDINNSISYYTRLMPQRIEVLTRVYGENYSNAVVSGGEITTGLTQEEEMDLIQERRKAR